MLIEWFNTETVSESIAFFIASPNGTMIIMTELVHDPAHFSLFKFPHLLCGGWIRHVILKIPSVLLSNEIPLPQKHCSGVAMTKEFRNIWSWSKQGWLAGRRSRVNGTLALIEFHGFHLLQMITIKIAPHAARIFLKTTMVLCILMSSRPNRVMVCGRTSDEKVQQL